MDIKVKTITGRTEIILANSLLDLQKGIENTMGIEIGDRNKINNSIIVNGAESANTSYPDNPKNSNVVARRKKHFSDKHPVLVNVLITVITSLLVGVILLFSFWHNIVEWIEGLF